LIEFCNNLKASSPDEFEIIFVTSDQDQEAFEEYYKDSDSNFGDSNIVSRDGRSLVSYNRSDPIKAFKKL
jgi:hypothetical protein